MMRIPDTCSREPDIYLAARWWIVQLQTDSREMELLRVLWRPTGLCVLYTLVVVTSHPSNRGEYELHKLIVTQSLCQIFIKF